MEDFRNEYCMHTATCGRLRATDVNQEVTLCGWAWHTRDHGGLIFIDLRDRDGYTQVVVDPDCVSEEDFHAAEHLGREYVLKVSGRVRERVPGLPVVAISGMTALDIVADMPGLSNVVCLRKPFRPNELMAAIEAARSGSTAT